LDLKGARVMVVGLGDTGLSMVRWLQRRGADVRATDSRAAPPHAATLRRELPQVPLTLGVAPDVSGVDMIAVSPGVDRRTGAVAQAAAHGVPVVGDVELFAQAQAQAARDAVPPVIAITGSNGKSTVTA